MYCFVLKNLMGDKKFNRDHYQEVVKDLRVGSLAKDVKLTRLDQAFRVSYDFLSIYYSLGCTTGYAATGYLAVSNFKNATFFQLKHFQSIEFSLCIPQHDFISEKQASLVYQIQKRLRYTLIHKKTRDQELVDLISELKKEIQTFKIS